MFAVMYPLFLFAALMQSAPAPAATTVPEIGRTHAKTFCERIQDNTSATVSSTLHNNQSIDAEIATMRATSTRDFSNDLYHAKYERATTKLAIDVNEELRTSRVQLDELRDLATKTPNDAFRKEINAYVDAMDKAHGEQAKIARAVLVGITIDNGRSAAGKDDDPSSDSQASVDASNNHASGQLDDPFSPLTAKARKFRAIGQLFAQMVPGIVEAENQAAEHAPKLLAACGQRAVSPDPSL